VTLYGLPVQRPVATAMFFLAIFLLGGVAWWQMPVELIPPITGDELYVSYYRPGSEPEVVEREILLPLEARVKEIDEVAETNGQITGAAGNFSVRFKPGTDLKLREMDLNRLVAELTRTQPPGTIIRVDMDPMAMATRFVMYISVSGGEDLNSLLDLVDDRVLPRLSAVSGVAQVLAGGGARREMTVRVDTDRAAAMDITPQDIQAALARSIKRLDFIGSTEDEGGRTAIVLDGRPQGEVSLGELIIVPGRHVRLRHVADVTLGPGEEESLFRVNGKPTVGMIVYQDADANLVNLGEALRGRLAELETEFAPQGVEFTINMDASETIGEQLGRLKKLATSGFIIALLVLYLFLRQWRAVGVVAIAVPASLLTALALLYVGDQSLNVVTLFGLAVGIGMLVDNSIVVYESVQRQLERAVAPDQAVENGVRRTVRAILAASLTNAVVFLPVTFVSFDDPFLRSLLGVLVLAILMPLGGSVLVAVGLVPLLARRLAAPAAMARIAELQARRENQGGVSAPDRVRELFGAVLVIALRRPGLWLTGTAVAVVLTILIALPLLIAGMVGQEPPEASQVGFPVQIEAGQSLERAGEIFSQLEEVTAGIQGIERVESMIREDGGSLTVHLLPREERPQQTTAGYIRSAIRQKIEEIPGVSLRVEARGGQGGELGSMLGTGSPAEVVISGPDARRLNLLAKEIEGRLNEIPQVGTVSLTSQTGQAEVQVKPDSVALAAFGLTADQVLPALSIVSREGVQMRTGFTMVDGSEVPLVIRRDSLSGGAGADLHQLRVATPAGVFPLAAVADVHRMPAPPTIVHHNGRREITVRYRFNNRAPESGTARLALEDNVREAIQQVRRPTGYTIETPDAGETFNWFKLLIVPVLLLLFAVLAVTFESLTLPLLVLLALPLTLLGATWGLVITGTPATQMALMGALALIGLTVNPAILLVDRMQQRFRFSGVTAGAAALAAVRERTRPVLMTTITTVAGLWPLALTTGQENEIWPPFATVVMGGLATSTVLTLLVIPVGFVYLSRLDEIFGRLGPWIVLGWAGVTGGIMAPLIRTGLITSTKWQILTTVLIGGVLLGVAVLIFRRQVTPEPEASDGPPEVEVRYLKKIYGKPGPVSKAWRVIERFNERVVREGGKAFDPLRARGRLVPLVLVLAGVLYLVHSMQSAFWRVVFVFIAAALVAAWFNELSRARSKADQFGRVERRMVGVLAPWIGLVYILFSMYLLPHVAENRPALRIWVPIVLGILLLFVQLGRRTALLLARGVITAGVAHGRLQRFKKAWRRFCRTVFGLDLKREEVRALSSINFTVKSGMVGILGPNGAGKTTLLRMLAGILDPSLGVITLGGVRLERLRRYLARYVGYLPQDFGLPEDLTAREYLEYYALLYQIRPAAKRSERLAQLLTEVGLGERADEKIGSFSGGMKQRVAVARTLLRLPPVIIVDEPTVGLDPRERIRFRNLLARLAEGRVVFFSTHVVEDVEVACERVIVMSRGRVVFDGLPHDLAGEAHGKVWVVNLAPDVSPAFPATALVVDQAPEPSGLVRSRILCDGRPHDEADVVSSNLEDGYLWLVREGNG
jgi:multidrug efflux pump subunit AcrB/ABC-type multidrug transport system ATPase subunit